LPLRAQTRLLVFVAMRANALEMVTNHATIGIATCAPLPSWSEQVSAQELAPMTVARCSFYNIFAFSLHDRVSSMAILLLCRNL
jgi:hypothetical protein